MIATISSLVNEVGYALIIPLAAMIYFINNRNPILGIITAFCGVSFGYGVSIFVGSAEISLIEYTRNASHLIDESMHISLTSNLYFIVATTFIISLIGTIIIEKIIAPKIGHYKKEMGEHETYSSHYEPFISHRYQKNVAQPACYQGDKQKEHYLVCCKDVIEY